MVLFVVLFHTLRQIYDPLFSSPTQKPICSTTPQESEHEQWLAPIQGDCKGTQPAVLIFTHNLTFFLQKGSRRAGGNNRNEREERARGWDGIKQKEKKQPDVCYYTQRHVRDVVY